MPGSRHLLFIEFFWQSQFHKQKLQDSTGQPHSIQAVIFNHQITIKAPLR